MVCIILIEFAYFGIQIKNLLKEEQSNNSQQSILEKGDNEIENTTIKKDIPCTSTDEFHIESLQLEKKSRIMPTEFKGFEIIGKLEFLKLFFCRFSTTNMTYTIMKI